MNTSTQLNTKCSEKTKFNIHLLDKYMLSVATMENISKSGYVDTSFLHKQKNTIEKRVNSLPVKVSSVNDNGNNKQIETSREPVLFIPREHDTLFWTFYILKNGIDKYHNMYQRNVVAEKAIKIELIEKLRANKGALKSRKCAPLHHIENALLNERVIDLKTLEALCILENISCLYVFDKCFYEINVEQDDTSISKLNLIVRKNHPEKYGYIELADIASIRSTKFKIENISKPIKAVSSYKLDELIELCEKLDIHIEGRKLKQRLYEELVKTICV